MAFEKNKKKHKWSHRPASKPLTNPLAMTFNDNEFFSAVALTAISSLFSVFLFASGSVSAGFVSFGTIAIFAKIADSMYADNRCVTTDDQIEMDASLSTRDQDGSASSTADADSLQVRHTAHQSRPKTSQRIGFLRAAPAILLSILFTIFICRTPTPAYGILIFLALIWPVIAMNICSIGQHCEPGCHRVTAVMFIVPLLCLLIVGPANLRPYIDVSDPVLDVPCHNASIGLNESGAANIFTVAYVDVKLPQMCQHVAWRVPQRVENDAPLCQPNPEPRVIHVKDDHRLVIEAAALQNGTNNCCGICERTNLPTFHLQLRCSPLEAWQWVAPVYVRNQDARCGTIYDGVFKCHEWPFCSPDWFSAQLVLFFSAQLSLLGISVATIVEKNTQQ